MPSTCCLILLVLILQNPPTDPGHADNPIYRELLADGLTLDGVTVRLPAPALADGQDAKASLATLVGIAGDERAVRELLRDSVTAPFILKTRDTKAGDAIIRQADLWFVVHANLDEVDPDQAIRQSNAEDIEVGNMRFGGKILSDQDLREAKIDKLPPLPGREEWYTHLNGRLLDRIQMEATDRAISTRTKESLLVAARTDLAFDRSARFPNRWSSVTRQGKNEAKGPDQSYRGGCSYVKISRLAAEPGALLVEAHFAFVEPLGWFQGNPILRSKISVIAQDQVRRLRREIEKRRGKK